MWSTLTSSRLRARTLTVPVVLTLHSDVLSWRRWTLGAADIPAEWLGICRGWSAKRSRAPVGVVAVSRFLADEVGRPVRAAYATLR